MLMHTIATIQRHLFQPFFTLGSLLQRLEQKAGEAGIDTLFVLTTQSSHWFQERGFTRGDVKSLPMAKRGLYNYRRNSRVLIKKID